MNLPNIPILHPIGEKEGGFLKQKELVLNIVDTRNGQPLGPWRNQARARFFSSPLGDFVWQVHPQGHRWRSHDAQIVVDFFKTYPKKKT
ncbi:MAG TPA: hypothetical protein DD440_07230 [Porticoccaceae bacterium]|nr:hypothetical protein [Porticoccaceae bacterium]